MISSDIQLHIWHSVADLSVLCPGHVECCRQYMSQKLDVQRGVRLKSIVYLVEIQQSICGWQLVKEHRLLKHLSCQLKSDFELNLLKYLFTARFLFLSMFTLI